MASLLQRLGFGKQSWNGRTSKPKTSSYRPIPQIWFSQPRDLPPFNFNIIRTMLIDPGVRLNLAMRAAPIYGVELAYEAGKDSNGKPIWQQGVQAKNPAVAAWVERQIKTIWHRYLPGILRAQVFGWSGGEITLKLSDHNLIEINQLLPRHASDVRLLTDHEGNRLGIRVKRVENGYIDLPFPTSWFHSFRPEDGELYSASILLGAYSPWSDKWLNGGGLDVRRLFMHKDAYRGLKIGYPTTGDVFVDGSERPISPRDIAQQIAEQAAAGAVLTYPSTRDAQGNEEWIIDEATVANNPQHILQYPKDLDDETRRGMEIPDDVISSDGTGAWAGRRIPLAAFYAGLDTWVTQIFADLRYSLEPLVMLNWGTAEDFDICHKPLALQAMEMQGNAGGVNPNSGDSSNDSNPYRMSLDPVLAVGQGVVSASEMVKAAKSVMGAFDA